MSGGGLHAVIDLFTIFPWYVFRQNMIRVDQFLMDHDLHDHLALVEFSGYFLLQFPLRARKASIRQLLVDGDPVLGTAMSAVRFQIHACR